MSRSRRKQKRGKCCCGCGLVPFEGHIPHRRWPRAGCPVLEEVHAYNEKRWKYKQRRTEGATACQNALVP